MNIPWGALVLAIELGGSVLAIGALLTADFRVAQTTTQIALAGVLLTIAAAIGGNWLSAPFTLLVEESDWEPEPDGGFAVRIPMSRHRHGREPKIEYYRPIPGGYEAVIVAKHVAEDGTATVGVNKPSRGKIVIK